MSFLYQMHITGFIEKDPERLSDKRGAGYYKALLVQPEGIKAADGRAWDRKTKLVAFGREAEDLGRLRAGDFVHVVGEPKAEAWTSKDGKPMASIEVVVKTIAAMNRETTVEAPRAREEAPREERQAARSEPEAARNGGGDDDLPF